MKHLFEAGNRTRRCIYSSGFTLIELLIVVAIILILIAIALPNFLEAQVRAKVVKATADVRSIGIAAEMYFNDFRAYPGESEPVMAEQDPTSERGLLRLTTPIPYMRAVPEDPFQLTLIEANYDVGEVHFYGAGGCAAEETRLIMAQAGPLFGVWSRGPTGQNLPDGTHPNYKHLGTVISSYSATNGTKSIGAIFHFAGEGIWWGIDTSAETDGVFNICRRSKLKDPSVPRNPVIVDGIPYMGQRPPDSYN